MLGPGTLAPGSAAWDAEEVLEGFRRRLSQSSEDMHEESLRKRFEDVDSPCVADSAERGPVRVCGEVAALQVVPRAGAPSLEVTVDDGTGRAVAVFTGRKRVGGLDPGRTVVLDGVARRERGRMVLLNPAYTLLP